jgi:hypothetical protein
MDILNKYEEDVCNTSRRAAVAVCGILGDLLQTGACVTQRARYTIYGMGPCRSSRGESELAFDDLVDQPHAGQDGIFGSIERLWSKGEFSRGDGR